jgi:mono/diheme cytochrome c family protein
MTHALARSRSLTLVSVGAALVLGFSAGHVSAQAVSYTDVQATQGAGAYSANCSTCHGDKAQGAEAPPLTGAQFDGVWRGGPVKDLYDFISQNMPADKPGTLSKDVYVSVLAFILKANNVPSGATPLVGPPPADQMIPAK